MNNTNPDTFYNEVVYSTTTTDGTRYTVIATGEGTGDVETIIEKVKE
jgi:hypothetical protein